MSTQKIFLPLPHNYTNDKDSIFNYAVTLMNFCKKYSKIADAHIVDFFTKNIWEEVIPKEWSNAFNVEYMSENENGIIEEEKKLMNKMIRLASFREYEEDWPESLKQFIRNTKELALAREISINDLQMECEEPIDKRILQGMNEKKLHEVKILSRLIAKLTKENEIRTIIDLGAGQGYLSRVLAYTYDLCVLAIDASNIQTCGAQKYQFRTEKSLGLLRKLKQEVKREENNMKNDEYIGKKEGKLTHVTQYVSSKTLTNLISEWNMKKVVDELGDCEFDKVDIIDESCSAKQLKREDNNLLVCGLHSCGVLSSTMLDLFINVEEIKCVVNVGCCYHLLYENEISEQENPKDEEKCSSFPLSKFFKEKNFYMGLTIRHLACQVPSRWSNQQESSIKAFEHHFYRALLQYILIKKELIKGTQRIGKLHHRDFTSFSTYCNAALKKLSIPLNSISQMESEKYYNEFKQKGFIHKIIIFWTLRAMLGPCFESIILLDKCLYLFENNFVKEINCYSVFNELKSPRNMVVVGIK
ncbi:methyltransferase domain-containing protein [Glomus cerebriforme]|uniref:Methyltransferase domain-containing protein n=1 Tax=Glomus cerebriforme TaxID=658196 RepID=A0A397SW43_9GLOM|nr:methyltransferase domain-containing protein [Glomus cerebriforme]